MLTHNETPEERTLTSLTRSHSFDLLALLVLCGFVFFYGLGQIPLLGPDEPRYVEVAREMYLSGDWISPRLAGGLWFEKPPLLYWMAASGFAIFGVSEFAARLGVAILSTLGVVIIYFFGSFVRSRAFGLASAFSLATMGLWIGFSRAATFDLPLAIIIECIIFTFFLADRTDYRGRASLVWMMLCGVLLGISLLAKGLAGPVIAGFVIGAHLVLTRRLRVALSRPGLLLTAGVLTILIAGIWYIPMFARHKWAFFEDFFLAHHFQRYFSDKYHHPQPFYFFIVVALAGTFPWSVLLLRSAIASFRRLRLRHFDPDSRLDLLIWLWILVPVVFFSFSGSKLPGYILPVFPALALAVGIAVDIPRDKFSWPFIATGLLIIAIAIGVAMRAPLELGVASASIRWIAAASAAVAVATVLVQRLKGSLAAFVSLGFGVAILCVATVKVVYPALGERESLRDLALLAKTQALPGERLVFYLDNHQGVNYYATDLPLREERSELLTLKHGDELAGLMLARGYETIEVMAYDRWVAGLEANPLLSVERLARQARPVGCSPGCDWVLVRVGIRGQGSGARSQGRTGDR